MNATLIEIIADQLNIPTKDRPLVVPPSTAEANTEETKLGKPEEDVEEEVDEEGQVEDEWSEEDW